MRRFALLVPLASMLALAGVALGGEPSTIGNDNLVLQV